MASDCGLGGCRPSWLGRFATFHVFLVVYGLLGTIQTIAFIYFVATLTTLEKRFKIPSQTTGIVMSGNEVSQIMLSLYLSYYGGRGNRPLWLACGVAFSAVSCLILALPHLMYGAGEDALALTVEHFDAARLLNGSYSAEDAASLCSADLPVEKCDAEEYSMMPVVIIFLSQFVLGIGTTLYFALGQTYLDDNTKKVHTPLLLGLVMSLRSVGPALGFILGFGCLSLYIDPSLTPVIDKKDPRWLGAWWLGWIVLGLAMFLFAFLIALFPKKLPARRKAGATHKAHRNKSVQGQIAVTRVKERQPLTKYMLDEFLPSAKAEAADQPGQEVPRPPPPKMTKDTFSRALVRLLRNKLLMLNNVSAVFYILGASGYITFLTKYMETQFQKSAAGANIFAGVAGILAMVGGFLISGLFISRFKPAPRKLLAWNVLIGVVYVVGEFSLIFVGCPDNGVQGAVMADARLVVRNDCNAGCNCELVKYSPVCHQERAHTYFSACHAGCGTSSLGADSTQLFTNCSCLVEPRTYSDLMLESPTQGAAPTTAENIANRRLALASTPESATNNLTNLTGQHPDTAFENYTEPVLDPSTTAATESRNISSFEPDLSSASATASRFELDLSASEAAPPESYRSPAPDVSSSSEIGELLARSALELTPSGHDAGSPRRRREPLETVTVTAGPCAADCARSFFWFILITCLMHSLGSSGRIGNILVNYRCVSTEDKPFAQGLGLLTISLFAFIPGPIIYGAIIDSTCLVWNESCGNQGNCWLYHKEDFRYYINATAVCFTAVATFFDILVWYYGKTLNLYGEPEEVKTIEN